MTADKNPLEDAVDQAIDAFIHAPIGLLFDGPASFPKLVRNGKNQVTNARMMGQFAVQMGRTELDKRAATLDGPVVDLLRGLGVFGPGSTTPPAPGPAPVPATPAPAARTAKEATKKAAKKAAKKPARPTSKASENKAAAKKAARAANAATKAATPAVGALPIPDYDSLSASQVVSRLRGLTPGQLDAVRAYESATRSRKTILNRVQQLAKT